MKKYQVVEALIPIANDIYDKESLDLIEIGNSSNRVICSPGEFQLGELIQEDEFRYENRGYENEDGSSSVSGVFAVRVYKEDLLTEQDLRDAVAEDIIRDADQFGDTTVLDELLKYISVQKLIWSLGEKEWPMFEHLLNK